VILVVILSALDQIIIFGYFAVVLVVGFLATRKSADAVDYLLAGRSLTLPIFVMTLVSTWYGGILGVGEYSYRFGISNWVVQGVPYYIFAAIFAFALAKRVRESNLLTIPDKLHQAYDLKTAVLGSFLTFLLMTPAPYVLMLAVLLHLLTGWGLFLCLLIGTVATTAYLFFGGFRADVYTDVLEYVLMFVGFGIILPFAYGKFGGLEFIQQHVPPLHLTWNGGNSLQFVLVWFFIALWTLVDPSFHQRCYAAQSGAVARKGILISIVFWFVFDAMTATAGLYARAALPDLDQPMMAYPLLAEVTLPAGMKGLFYVGLLATIMSTLNTLAFVSATCLGRDIVWRVRRDADESKVNRYTQWGLVATALVSVALAWFIPSVIRLWYTIGTVIIPGLLVPLVSSYFGRWRVSAPFAFAAMLCGWVMSLVWLAVGWTQQLGVSDYYPWGIEPMYPGLVVSLIAWGLGMIARGRRKPQSTPRRVYGG
jgi:SSS family solute:Na+ symporter